MKLNSLSIFLKPAAYKVGILYKLISRPQMQLDTQALQDIENLKSFKKYREGSGVIKSVEWIFDEVEEKRETG